ncbi:MAG: methionine adenosyltransferase [Candidatus Altiarchaeota archaeon]|nr:methionine adenosyltransferase [Candidatus Altiarchaeota archaeon]
MARNIVVDRLVARYIEDTAVEIVERKGIGHPDSMSDGMADAVSRALCKEYLKRFKTVMHHNTDQTEVVAGQSRPNFGGGKIVKPIYALLVGRATDNVDGEEIPVSDIAQNAAKSYIRENILNLNPDTQMVVDTRYGQGSADLQTVFKEKRGIPGANDTSFGIGFAPFSEVEQLTLQAERWINSRETKKNIPGLGEDVKVMGLREKDKITLTICIAQVDKYISGVPDYMENIEKVKESLAGMADGITSRDVKIMINTGDVPARKEEGLFLTVTGTSAENGDDGSVGRGNRVSGLITPGRPMSMEAAAGKNPINHVGKIYNVLALRMADRIVKEIPEIKQVDVQIMSQIGSPIDNPRMAYISILTEDKDFKSAQKQATEIADGMLASVSKVTEDIINGKVSVF